MIGDFINDPRTLLMVAFIGALKCLAVALMPSSNPFCLARSNKSTFGFTTGLGACTGADTGACVGASVRRILIRCIR